LEQFVGRSWWYWVGEVSDVEGEELVEEEEGVDEKDLEERWTGF